MLTTAVTLTSIPSGVLAPTPDTTMSPRLRSSVVTSFPVPSSGAVNDFTSPGLTTSRSVDTATGYDTRTSAPRLLVTRTLRLLTFALATNRLVVTVAARIRYRPGVRRRSVVDFRKVLRKPPGPRTSTVRRPDGRAPTFTRNVRPFTTGADTARAGAATPA